MWSFSWCIMGMLWCSFGGIIGCYGELWGSDIKSIFVFFVSFWCLLVSFFRLFLSFNIVVKVLSGWYKDAIWVCYRVLSRCYGSVMGVLLGNYWGIMGEGE